ncbi:MAG: large conductance mechanosensitive channel protein MscL [Clostridia bacterium]|nr:large conductance mechanosensitive channel protein MscL [Clostridia bacterium]
MKKFLGEFKTLIMRGNVMDMSVGVIVGGAFHAIVNSLINDLLMPFIGLATGGMNFTEQFVVLKQGATAGMKYASLSAATADGAAVFAYGSFITAVINFLIMALVIFTLVRTINRLATVGKKKEAEEEPAPTTKICPFCKSEIAIDATRCAHCTAELPEEEAAE